MLYLGEKLRSKRESHGLSQEALGQRLHVTRQTISGWERGRSEPDLASLQALANIYGSTLDELLEQTIPVPPYQTLRKTALALYSLGLLLTGAAIWGSIVQRAGILPLVLCFGYGVLINTIIWFAFSGAIQSGDVSMLAGYDEKQGYHVPTLKRVLDAQRFLLILGSTLLCLPCTLAAVFAVSLHFPIVVFLCVFHIVCILSGFWVIDRKYSATLYLNPEKARENRVSKMPLLLFLGAMLLTLIATAMGVAFGSIANNSPAAWLFVLFMTLAFLLQISCFVVDITAAKALAEQKKPYKPKKYPLWGYLLCIGLDILLFWVCL